MRSKRNKVEILEQEIKQIEKEKKDLISYKDLLFETGALLEKSILSSLNLLGFQADNFTDSHREFDAVFTSKEGRFIGEVEGKDNKAIAIKKIDQLNRNIHSDFSRDEVNVRAKGVLFGNPYRLNIPEERKQPFTDKCLIEAGITNLALINTPDLFAPIRYLHESQDKEYARKCRESILNTSGGIVEFPPIPTKKNI